MASLAVRKVNNFKVDKEISLNDLNTHELLCTIKPTNEDNININGGIYKKFVVSLFKTINKDIIINISYLYNLDDADSNATQTKNKRNNSKYPKYEKTNNYKHQISFNVFYNNKNRLFIIDAKVSLAKTFIRLLEKSKNPILNNIKFETLRFNFSHVKEHLGDISSISFRTGNNDIKTKRFSGDDVTDNDEARKAFDDNQITYMVLALDLQKSSRTIGFSQSGSIVIYNSLVDLKDDDHPYPYLNILIDILNNGNNKFILYK